MSRKIAQASASLLQKVAPVLDHPRLAALLLSLMPVGAALAQPASTDLFCEAAGAYMQDISTQRVAGAELDAEGQILVDHCMRTSVKGLYAAGCVTPAMPGSGPGRSKITIRWSLGTSCPASAIAG